MKYQNFNKNKNISQCRARYFSRISLYTNKRKFEERNNNFTNKRFRNDPSNTPETIQSYLIKRKINHEIDRSHKKQKLDNDNISNTSTSNINDTCKLNQNTNKIKNVQVKLTDVMTLIHKQKNQKAYKEIIFLKKPRT